MRNGELPSRGDGGNGSGGDGADGGDGIGGDGAGDGDDGVRKHFPVDVAVLPRHSRKQVKTLRRAVAAFEQNANAAADDAAAATDSGGGASVALGAAAAAAALSSLPRSTRHVWVGNWVEWLAAHAMTKPPATTKTKTMLKTKTKTRTKTKTNTKTTETKTTETKAVAVDAATVTGAQYVGAFLQQCRRRLPSLATNGKESVKAVNAYDAARRKRRRLRAS
jgi:hypothetical protein